MTETRTCTKARFVKVSLVRKYCNEKDRRVSRQFISYLDDHIEKLLLRACWEHNGGKKTLGQFMARWAAGDIKL